MMLAVQNCFAGYGAGDVLQDVSLQVPEGHCVALIGANGAGKTTLLHVLSGLLPQRAGRVMLGEQDLTTCTPAQRLAAGLTHCPEGRRVFARMSVADNLAMGAYLRRDSFGIADDIAAVYARFPKLHERRAQLAGTLSGGEQQMLALGRALLSQPRMLMLDEPSLGLAPRMAQQVFAVVRELSQQGMGVLLVEQNAAMALALSEHAYVLELGSIRLQGPSAALKDDPRIAQAYLGT